MGRGNCLDPRKCYQTCWIIPNLILGHFQFLISNFMAWWYQKTWKYLKLDMGQKTTDVFTRWSVIYFTATRDRISESAAKCQSRTWLFSKSRLLDFFCWEACFTWKYTYKIVPLDKIIPCKQRQSFFYTLCILSAYVWCKRLVFRA